jgi:hypothetical protein
VIARQACLSLLLAGCAAGPVPGPTGPEQCVALFETYDRIKASMSTPSGRADRMVIPPVLQRPVQDLQEAGCLTMSDELDVEVAAPPVVDGGAAIAATGVHAGIVTDMGDEAAALAFFEAQGIEARSIGAAGLGRRIYLGPFATQGALDGAMALARAAGFASPYPADF